MIFTKRFIFVLLFLVSCFLCSGCQQNKNPEEKSSVKQETIKYQNGTVLLKTNDRYNTTDQEEISEEKKVDNVKFGPEDLDFNH